MNLRKPKQFSIGDHTITIDAADWQRVRPLISRMRAVEMTSGNPATLVFLVNLGTKDRPAHQPLTGFILDTGAYVVLKDRTDPGDHTRSNLVRG